MEKLLRYRLSNKNTVKQKPLQRIKLNYGKDEDNMNKANLPLSVVFIVSVIVHSITRKTLKQNI